MTVHHQGNNGSTVTKGVRRTTAVTVDVPRLPDTEVIARSTRRRLSLAYKLQVLDTVARLRTQGHGAVGAHLAWGRTVLLLSSRIGAVALQGSVHRPAIKVPKKKTGT